ncbi:mce related family protein [Collimonas arenae]|uniref:Mce related family protein n=1 Tax=Collimonas arenae TaxID=279058 RepID=A0A127PQH2_9BURK|nr:MlaD family protein [Collimonas arenae]AMO99998.1 mce related family protein [Collimonas arenae]AMP09893.1 mce related family protein [Collimonas arenae]
MSDENTVPPLPEPKLSRKRDWLPSLIWLIPIVAAVVGLTLVVKILVERGPSITITFRTAEGLEAGKTKVKYRDVDIGVVQTITLSKDRKHVLANVQLSKEAESFTATDTRFWVVRPRVAASGISGLGTLLSGAYIGADAGVSKDKKDDFTGLEVQPIVALDSPGKQFMLHATDIGSLDIGSPIYFRRIKVGQLAAYDLDEDGKGVTMRIFIDKPYEKFIGVNTRFWHASGFDMQINASGFKLRTQSLATVVLGGIAFQAPEDNLGPLAKENTTFALAEDQETAMKEPDGPSETVLLYFNQSLRGLTPGTTIDFRGVVLGEVKSIGLEYDAKKREFQMPVAVQIYPERLGRKYAEDERHSEYTAKQRLEYMVSRGLRAQLRTGNLLTGQLYIALDFFPKAPPVKIDTSSPVIVLPTIPNSLDEIQSQIAEIAKNLSKVPFDQIAADLRTTLGTMNRTLLNAEQLTKSLNNDVAPEIASAMKDVRKTLDNANRTLSDNSPLQQDIRQTLQELTRSAASLRVLTDYLERHPESLIRGKQEENK